jgi:serine/threonine protein kinase
MGAVYEAEQDHPRRTVALKIIKSGIASAELLRRFEQESQALGRLQHPGIAQIYEAGTVDTGFGPQPYFAMELIRGFLPRDYADTHHLNAGERMEIMAKICEAVHHAHQRGLIHRDLKPANILIDEAGQPKILDFGVARATDSDTRATVQTDLGQLIGTLAYMSPEQVLADPLDIDTRSASANFSAPKALSRSWRVFSSACTARSRSMSARCRSSMARFPAMDAARSALCARSRATIATCSDRVARRASHVAKDTPPTNTTNTAATPETSALCRRVNFFR